MNEIEVHIEISKNSRIKYEFDHENNKLICDRFLHTSFSYPFNYGYIPHTLSEDGDPLDAVVLCGMELVPNCYINCKIIGVLVTEDEKGRDDKLILVPSNNIDPKSKLINNIDDLDYLVKEQINHFFKHYKDLEPNKWIKINGYLGVEDAIKIFNTSKMTYLSKI